MHHKALAKNAKVEVLRLRRALWACMLMTTSHLALAAVASASDLDAEEIRGQGRQKQISVLQNRFFTKAWRPELGFFAGAFINESYVSTQSVGLRAALFANEWLGLEYQWAQTQVSDSQDRQTLRSLSYYDIGPDGEPITDAVVHPDPVHNAIHGFQDMSLVFAPFYGKLNLVDRLIVYSDLYLSAGLSHLSTDQGDTWAINYGAGQRFYIAKSWSLRVDFRVRRFEEMHLDQSTVRSSMSFDFGGSYFF